MTLRFDRYGVRNAVFFIRGVAIAGIWLIVSVAAFFTMRAQLRGADHFSSLQSELREDLKAIKEAL